MLGHRWENAPRRRFLRKIRKVSMPRPDFAAKPALGGKGGARGWSMSGAERCGRGGAQFRMGAARSRASQSFGGTASGGEEGHEGCPLESGGASLGRAGVGQSGALRHWEAAHPGRHDGPKMSLRPRRADDALGLRDGDGHGRGGESGRRGGRGFAALAQERGAQAIVATLWSVNDASTAPFMGRCTIGRFGMGRRRRRLFAKPISPSCGGARR